MRSVIVCLLCFAGGMAGADSQTALRMFDPKLTSAQRNDACFALRGNREPEMLQTMRLALKVDAVRTCAARNLLEAEAARELLDAAKDEAPEVRAVAIRQLGVMHRPEFLPVLARAAADTSSLLVSTSAAQALCQYEGNTAVGELKSVALKGAIPGAIALSRLAVVNSGEALPIARRLLDSPDITERLLALRVLGESGDESDLPALRKMAEHKEQLVARQRGFGLIPAIDLARAAEATIAQIESRMRSSVAAR